ncbi:MAG: acetyl-CoA carboxylase biotin carboxyl carrier protein [Betaproteobacteria bacterium]
MELRELRREIAGLARIMNAHDIAEIEITADGMSLKLRRAEGQVRVRRAPEAVDLGASLEETTPPTEAAPEPRAEVAARDNRITITAPMVGTFYRAPAPDADPYVKIGDTVSPGQVVCIIEAMKIMNEIQAEVRGRVLEILVENAEPVEYGQPLFVLETL